MGKWILLGCIIILILVVWFLFFTPYPFVFLLRRQKDEKREKGPNHIADIRSRIQIACDLNYPSKYPNHTFDLYYGKAPKRILVWIHGGSFIGGTSAGAKNFAAMHADEGTIVCAINYAYAPEYAYPTQIKQVDEFLQYLPSFLQKEQLPSDLPLFLGGDSAGANIAASFTCHKVHPHLCKQANVILRSMQEIKGNLLFCGPYDFTEDFHKTEFEKFAKFFRYIGWSYLGHRNWEKREEKNWASPYLTLTKQHPPLYVCDGKKFSFLWQGRALVEKAKEFGIPTASRFYEDMTHEFQFDYQKNAEEAMQVYEDSLAFLNQYGA